MARSMVYTETLLMLCLLVGVGCKNATPLQIPEGETSLGTGKVIESGYFLDKKFLNGQRHLSNKYEYVLQSTADYNKFTKLNDQIKNVIDKQNLTLTNSDSPVDPNNSKLIYFSGFEQDAPAQKLVNKIYSLNLATNKVLEVFSHQDTPEEHKIGVTLRIVGREEFKIIIKSDNIDNPPGDCYDYWADPQAGLSYLNLNDVKKGLQEYIVPKERVVQAEKEVQECMKDNN